MLRITRLLTGEYRWRIQETCAPLEASDIDVLEYAAATFKHLVKAGESIACAEFMDRIASQYDVVTGDPLNCGIYDGLKRVNHASMTALHVMCSQHTATPNYSAGF